VLQLELSDSFVLSVSTDRLVSHTFEAVHRVDWPERRSVEEGTPEAVLRTLLTYCYAAGIFASEEIQESIRHDPVLRYLASNHFPVWQEIRGFRRRNLPWLIESLAHLFQDLADSVFQSGDYTSLSMMRFVPTVVDLRVVAEQRLARAVQCDSVAMDH
jgi:hypothetical protein